MFNWKVVDQTKRSTVIYIYYTFLLCFCWCCCSGCSVLFCPPNLIWCRCNLINQPFKKKYFNWCWVTQWNIYYLHKGLCSQISGISGFTRGITHCAWFTVSQQIMHEYGSKREKKRHCILNSSEDKQQMH